MKYNFILQIFKVNQTVYDEIIQTKILKIYEAVKAILNGLRWNLST